MSHPREFINGICQQLLFSPEGDIEGALIKAKGQVVQVSVEPDMGLALQQATGPGKRLRVLAVPDHSPKTADSVHPVYCFSAFADAAGAPQMLAQTDPAHTTLRGIVAALHYARHGQPNGVILDSGDFIHLRPHGMARSGLVVGSQVDATGAARSTALGTRVLEATRVNELDLD
jgi:hypothetical protein